VRRGLEVKSVVLGAKPLKLKATVQEDLIALAELRIGRRSAQKASPEGQEEETTKAPRRCQILPSKGVIDYERLGLIAQFQPPRRGD
jgi:hypothetical protein